MIEVYLSLIYFFSLFLFEYKDHYRIMQLIIMSPYPRKRGLL